MPDTLIIYRIIQYDMTYMVLYTTAMLYTYNTRLSMYEMLSISDIGSNRRFEWWGNVVAVAEKRDFKRKMTMLLITLNNLLQCIFNQQSVAFHKSNDIVHK